MIRRALSLSIGLLFAGSAIGAAQRTDSVAPLRPRAGRLGAPGGKVGRNGQPPISPKQQAMVRQVRQAFAGVVKRELNLNDDQMRHVQQVDDKYQLQRNQLNRDERDARQGLKAALEDSASAPDQARVEGYMARLVQSQRRRADILEAEQKEFAGFLTPVQRAKFFALRDQLNRRIAEARQEGRLGGPPPPP
jgi:hypothetical protein